MKQRFSLKHALPAAIVFAAAAASALSSCDEEKVEPLFAPTLDAEPALKISLCYEVEFKQ